MSQANGSDEPTSENHPPEAFARPRASVECELFESLVHHLIEKGVLTRNDALSVVQTVAQVKVGAMEEAHGEGSHLITELSALKRLYASFEMVPDRPISRRVLESGNVTELRPPLHGNHPEFPET